MDKPTAIRSRVTILGAGMFGPFPPGEDGFGLAQVADVRGADKRLRHADRVTLLSLAGAAGALEDAKLGRQDPARRNASVYLGNSYGAFETNLSHQRTVSGQGGALASPAVFSYTLPNVAAGWISIREGLKGPLFSFATGGLSAADAISSAHSSLRSGFEGGPSLAGAVRARVEDVDRTLDSVRGGCPAAPTELCAFLVLSACALPDHQAVELASVAAARAGGCPDPLEAVVSSAGGGSIAIAAGDASRDAETAIRLKSYGIEVAASVSDLIGDAGEAAPAAGAVIAYRWLKGLWEPSAGHARPESVLVAGLDACGRRGFAMLLSRSQPDRP